MIPGCVLAQPLYNLAMPSEQDAVRFWSKVLIAGPDGCWPWMAARAKERGGYGFFRLSGVTVYAHRLAYELAVGEIGPGEYVCHKCNRPPCCNPKHLYLGNAKTNGRDAAAHGKIGRWSRRGWLSPSARLSPDDVREIRVEIARGRSDLELGRKYGVTATAIRHIRLGRNWRWLDS